MIMNSKVIKDHSYGSPKISSHQREVLNAITAIAVNIYLAMCQFQQHSQVIGTFIIPNLQMRNLSTEVLELAQATEMASSSARI